MHPAWWVAEELRSKLTSDHVAKLKKDRRDFLKWWGSITGGAAMAGRVEQGVRGVESGDPTSRALWLSVSESGMPLPYHGWYGLPDPGEIANVLISPEPVIKPTPAPYPRQWRSESVETIWPFLVLDVDKSDVLKVGSTVDELLISVFKNAPPPSLVVDSGSGGVHLWWALTHGIGADHAQRLHKHLAALFCGDAAQTHARPSLRLPGSTNVKWGKPDTLLTCTINRQYTDLDVRTDPTYLERKIPRVHQWSPPRDSAEVEVYDCPEWIRQTLLAAGADKVSNVRRTLRGRVRPVAVPDVCPMCGSAGTAWVYVDEARPRLGCHRRKSCRGHSSMHDLAAKYGIEPDEVHAVDPEDLARDPALEAALAPPEGVPYSVEARAEEQKAIGRAAEQAWVHGQKVGSEPHVWVIESSVGAGKDYVLSRVSENMAGSKYRFDMYAKSQHHIKGKVAEWPNPDRAFRCHISPVSLTLSDGETCRLPEAMSANTAAGWEPSRICGTCEYALECNVKDGFADLGGVSDEHIDAYSTRRLETAGPVSKDRPVWVDESFRLVTDTVITRQHLEAFLKCGVALESYRKLAKGLLDTWAGLPKGLQAPVSPRRWSEVYDSCPEPRKAVRTMRPGGMKPPYPKWIYEVLRCTWYMAHGHKPHEHGSFVWLERNTATMWEGTLDKLPMSTVWTNATYHVYADIIEKWKPGMVTRVGKQLTPNHLTRLHYPHRGAVRGGYNGIKRLLKEVRPGHKVGNRDFENAVREAVRLSVERWREESWGSEATPRVLVASYKAIADHGWGEGPEDFCRSVGATAVDYYERLVGVNDYAGWEVLVMVGEPNPASGGQEAAALILMADEGDTYISTGMRQRISQETLVQVEGRLRAVTSDVPQVVCAVTPMRPAPWGWTGELLEAGIRAHAQDHSMNLWNRSAELMECLSTPTARLWRDITLANSFLGYGHLPGYPTHRLLAAAATKKPRTPATEILVKLAEMIDHTSTGGRERAAEWRLADDALPRAAANLGLRRTPGGGRARYGPKPLIELTTNVLRAVSVACELTEAKDARRWTRAGSRVEWLRATWWECQTMDDFEAWVDRWVTR